MLRIFVTIISLVSVVFAIWSAVTMDSGIGLRLFLKCKSCLEPVKENHTASVIELWNSNNGDQITTYSNSIRLKGLLSDRTPASITGKIQPYIVNKTTGDKAVVFLDDKGQFYTDIIPIVPGENTFAIEYREDSNVVSSRIIKVRGETKSKK